MKYVYLLSVLLFSDNTFAQKSNTDVIILDFTSSKTPRYDDVTLKFHDGFVVKSSGDTLKGKILFIPVKDGETFNIVINENIVPAELIESISVKGSDTNYSNLPYTEFRKFKKGSSTFYRKLMQGRLELYDDWLLVDEEPGKVCFDEMLIGRDDQVKNVTNFWTTSDKKYLIRKVNTLMNANLSFHQFKGKFAVLRWLKRNI